MLYRREVDGLRAVAVLPVILFHAGIPFLSGGFVGVDIFFVISGYLITSILLKSIDDNNFSIMDFYERRARRILPALTFITITSLIAAWIILLPEDMKSFALSLTSVTLFSSNILFWKTSGYFDLATELKPLIHTWSLSVEEQYYLLFPLLLLLIKNTKNKQKALILGLIALSSLGLAELLSRSHPSFNFYLLPTRAWEILAGALIAFKAPPVATSENRKSNELFSLIGAALIITAILFFNERTPTPSLLTLIPVLGASLIIAYATPETIVGRLLGARPAVYIGLISYSAYLWHQPIFAFAKHYSLTKPSATGMALLILCILPLSHLTWRYIETPFRDKKKFTRKKIFSLSLTFGGLFFLIGVFGYISNGYFYRPDFTKKFAPLESAVQVNVGLNKSCINEFSNTPVCRTSENPEILIWGDSYAMHLVDGFLASNNHPKIEQKTISLCGPFLGISPVNSSNNGVAWAKNCIKFNDQVIAHIKKSNSIKYVVLSSSLEKYLENDALVFTSDKGIINGEMHLERYVKNTIREIEAAGKKPIFFSPTPSSGYNTGRCLLKAQRFSQSQSGCDFPLTQALANRAHVINMLHRISESVKVVWLQDGMCPNETCLASTPETLIYRDYGHLSIEGSRYIGKKMGFYDLVTQQKVDQP